MNGRHAICLVIDGLRASALGCYGNTISRTPQLDDLASRSAIAEWFWADAPSKEKFYQSVWQGTHSMRSDEHRQQLPPLHDLLRQDDVPLRLITDEPWMANWLSDASLEGLARLESNPESTAASLAETAMAQFCSAAVAQLEQWLGDGTGSVSWIHSRGLLGAWDAPLELREELLADDELEPLDFLVPPTALDVDDPDQLLLYRSAYAAQASVIDTCIGALCEAIDELMSDRETMMIVTSSQGFALGEHGNLGSAGADLFSEQLHLPWLLHFCEESGAPLPRIGGLSQPTDIHATLLDWLGIEVSSACDGRSLLPHLEDGSDIGREIAFTVGSNGENIIRTPEWLLRRTNDDSPQLFAKPDDRWEHNDVAVRCPEEMEQLSELAEQVVQYAAQGQPLPLTSDSEASE